MLNATLKSSISRLWDKFWSGGISNPLTAIEQISYLLFMKRLDELDIKKKHDSEFTGESYESLFQGKMKIALEPLSTNGRRRNAHPYSNQSFSISQNSWKRRKPFCQTHGQRCFHHFQTYAIS